MTASLFLYDYYETAQLILIYGFQSQETRVNQGEFFSWFCLVWFYIPLNILPK